MQKSSRWSPKELVELRDLCSEYVSSGGGREHGSFQCFFNNALPAASCIAVAGRTPAAAQTKAIAKFGRADKWPGAAKRSNKTQLAKQYGDAHHDAMFDATVTVYMATPYLSGGPQFMMNDEVAKAMNESCHILPPCGKPWNGGMVKDCVQRLWPGMRKEAYREYQRSLNKPDGFDLTPDVVACPATPNTDVRDAVYTLYKNGRLVLIGETK